MALGIVSHVVVSEVMDVWSWYARLNLLGSGILLASDLMPVSRRRAHQLYLVIVQCRWAC